MPSAKEKYGDLLSWAQRRGLTVDPRFGRDEDPNKRRARHAATELAFHVKRIDEMDEEGEAASFADWNRERAEEYAKALRKLQGEMGW